MLGSGFGVNSRGGLSINSGRMTLDTRTGNMGIRLTDHLSVDKDGINWQF